MKKEFLIKIPALLVLLLGLTAITGWIVGIKSLVDLGPGSINMVFNTALCFNLAGLALLLPNQLPKTQLYGRILLGSVLTLFAALIISQDIFHYNLGLDQLLIKVWLPGQSTFPGRMSYSTAVSFICSGLALILLPYVRHRLLAVILQILITAILLLGVSTIIAYIFHLEYLYTWYTRMSALGAIGFVILSMALWSIWSTSEEYKQFYQGYEDKKILLVSTVILFIIACIAGFAGFAVSSESSRKLLEQTLQQTLNFKKIDFVQMLEKPLNEVIYMQNAEVLQQIVLKQNTVDNAKLLLTQLSADKNITSIQVYNDQYKLLVAAGNRIKKPELLIPINLPFAAKLEWQNNLYINFTAPIIKEGNTIGYFTTEWPLNYYNNIMQVAKLGHSAELVICASRNKDYAICLPTNKVAKPFFMQFMQNGQPLPIWYALLGQTNIVMATDYQRQPVIAAYSPIHNMGLGMVAKINTNEIYQPIRTQLKNILPLILWAIVIGLALLYWQVLPLIRRITSSEKRLLADEAYLQAIINNMADGIITINEQGKIESVNPKVLEIFNYKAGDLIGNNIALLMSLHLRETYQGAQKTYVIMNEATQIGNSAVEMVARRRSGEYFAVEINITNLKLDDKYLFVCIVRDISARNAAEAVLYESEVRFRTAFDNAAIGMAIVSLEGRWLKVNQALCEIVGYTETEMLEINFQTITHPDDLLNDLRYIQKLMAGEIPNYNMEKRYIHKNGTVVWILLSVSLIRDNSSKPLYFISQVQDITSRKQVEERLRMMAYSDSLTGLANRVQLENNLKLAIANAIRHEQHIGIVFLDLDDFKNINDTLGHAAGDQLLQTIAHRLKACVRSTDTVARIGGDEFVLLITEVNNIENIAIVAHKIIAGINNPIAVKGYDLHVTTSIGISCYPEDGRDVQTLLKNADMALYRAKLLGRNNFQFCTKEMTKNAQEKLTKEQALRHALEKNEFLLHYQPIIDINTKKIVGVEALLRWDNPEFGLLGADDIVPIAEEIGLTPIIGNWVLKNACQQLQDWQALGLRDLQLSINISPRQFKHLDFINMVTAALKTTQIAGHQLEFQITESLFVNDPPYNLMVFKELTRLGIKIAVDNFGTGYSSLSYMQQLVINKINIDRTFVLGMLTHVRSLEVVKAAVAMAHQLNIKACAEGVENIEQFNLLTQFGCSEVQGYLISVPLPSEQVTAFLMRYSHAGINFLS